jgi:hypothetical protein
MKLRTKSTIAFSVVLLLSGMTTKPMSKVWSALDSGKSMFKTGKTAVANAASNMASQMPEISKESLSALGKSALESSKAGLAKASDFAKTNAGKIADVARTIPAPYAAAGVAATAALGTGAYVYSNTPKAQSLPSFGKALGLDINHGGPQMVVDENLAALEVPVTEVSLRNQGPVSGVASENGTVVVSYEPMREPVAPVVSSELDDKRLQELDQKLAQSKQDLDRQKKLLSVETDLVDLVRSDRELDLERERLMQEEAAIQLEATRLANQVADKTFAVKATRKEVTPVASLVEPKADVALSSAKNVRFEDDEILPLPAPVKDTPSFVKKANQLPEPMNPVAKPAGFVADNKMVLKSQSSNLDPIAPVAAVYKAVAIPVKAPVAPLVKPAAKPVVTVTITSEPVVAPVVTPVVSAAQPVEGVKVLRDALLTRENNEEKVLNICKDIVENCAKDRTFDINAIVDENGNTLLHLATTQKYLKVVQFLIANGAQPSMIIKNHAGKSPWDLAVSLQKAALVKCFTTAFKAQCK